MDGFFAAVNGIMVIYRMLEACFFEFFHGESNYLRANNSLLWGIAHLVLFYYFTYKAGLI